jgi:phosphoglycolate phosphatase-like HAD superfamily hydrolase
MKLFVWDFHVVLEIGNEKAVIDISNEVLAKAGYKERFTDEDNEKFYGLKWYQYFERLLSATSEERCQKFQEECLELQTACFKHAENDPSAMAKHIKPTDHAAEVLTKIKESGNRQIVISNTRQNDLIWFLDATGLHKFFQDNHIIGVNAHQTHVSKTDALKDFLKDKEFDEIIAIGDSEDDLKLGRAVGAITYYYRHPHRKHYETENADFIINDLREILCHISLVL